MLLASVLSMNVALIFVYVLLFLMFAIWIIYSIFLFLFAKNMEEPLAWLALLPFLKAVVLFRFTYDFFFGKVSTLAPYTQHVPDNYMRNRNIAGWVLGLFHSIILILILSLMLTRLPEPGVVALNVYEWLFIGYTIITFTLFNIIAVGITYRIPERERTHPAIAILTGMLITFALAIPFPFLFFSYSKEHRFTHFVFNQRAEMYQRRLTRKELKQQQEHSTRPNQQFTP